MTSEQLVRIKQELSGLTGKWLADFLKTEAKTAQDFAAGHSLSDFGTILEREQHIGKGRGFDELINVMKSRLDSDLEAALAKETTNQPKK